MTDWTPYTETVPTWIAEELLGYLLCEDGSRLLNEDGSGILLEESRTDDWSKVSNDSASWTKKTATATNWTEHSSSSSWTKVTAR